MKKKVLIAVMCVAMMIVGGLATMAYLTDEDAATNTFTSGKVDILLDEAKVDEDGLKIEGADRVKANDYQLFPGHTYDKDPMVTVVDGSEDCYVRMFVTINNQKELDAAFKEMGGLDLTTFLLGYDATYWVLMGETVNVEDNSRTYEFWHETAVDPGALTPLFTNVHIPGEITVDGITYNIGNDEMAAFEDLTIDVIAHAIQAEGFGTADAAWAVWKDWK